MSAATPTTGQIRRRQFRQFRQMLVGLLALPLSAVPFLAYGMFTPEGRILRDRLIVAVSPPHLPDLSPAEQQVAATAAPRYQRRVMALVYHGVGSYSDAEGGFVVSPGRFGEHLATLRAAGMATVTATDVARAFAGEAALPDNAVMITFDDGRADALMFADPLLDEAGMKATMFVISSATDRPNLYYASWDRIEQAARSGRWDIEAHTHDAHRQEVAEGGGQLPRLTSLEPGESLDGYRARIRKDLDHNGEAIEDHVGRRPVAFAYPFGAYGADRTNDPGIRDILREEVSARYRLALHQDDQETVPLLDATQDRVGLRRLEVGDWSGADLLARISRAAGGTGVPAPGVTVDPPAVEAPTAELVAPMTETEEGRSGRPTSPATSPGRPRRPWPNAAAATTGPEPSSTTSTEPSTTTSTGLRSTTTTEPPPAGTTSTSTSTTTTTRPSSGSSTTTTTEKPCRGRGDKPCGRDR